VSARQGPVLWGVWAAASGKITGSHEPCSHGTWLVKQRTSGDRYPEVFTSPELAEARAQSCRDSMDGHKSSATFTYTVRPFPNR
jgi:hypothetical protein